MWTIGEDTRWRDIVEDMHIHYRNRYGNFFDLPEKVTHQFDWLGRRVKIEFRVAWADEPEPMLMLAPPKSEEALERESEDAVIRYFLKIAELQISEPRMECSIVTVVDAAAGKARSFNVKLRDKEVAAEEKQVVEAQRDEARTGLEGLMKDVIAWGSRYYEMSFKSIYSRFKDALGNDCVASIQLMPTGFKEDK